MIGRSLIGGTIVAMCIPCAAHAQSDTTTGDIVVTASKRETALADTPMSLTVIDAQAIVDTGSRDFSDIAKLVPGLSFTDAGPGNKRYALRGLQSAGEPEVALYYDEVPIAGLPGASLDTGDSQLDLKLVDIERIEVLRGPQGTLYGNGSMGGAIRILSRRPEFDRADATIGVGAALTDRGGPSVRTDAVVNLPIVRDKLALRLVGYAQSDGGWIDNRPISTIALRQIDRSDINWERTYGGRASLKFQSSPGWSITAIASFQRLKTGDAFETYPTFAIGGDPYVAKSFVRRPWTDHAEVFNLIAEGDLGFASLVATGSYQHRYLQRNIDTTRFVLTQFGCNEFTFGQTCFGPPIVPADSYSDEFASSWSSEVRLTSKGAGPFQWTAGAFWQDTTTGRLLQVASVNQAGLVDLDSTGMALRRIFARQNRDTFAQYALFGEASYTLYRGLTATLGLRWFHSDRTDQQVILQQFFPGAPTGAQPFQRFAQSALFKKAELSYKSPAGLIFAQAAQGFRAGGPNYPGGFALTAPPYRADSVWDYEIGYRGTFLDNRLRLDAAIFDIEWSNLQQLIPQALFTYITNGARARSRGFEAEVAWSPVRTVDLSAAVTYNDARLVGPQPVSVDPASQIFDGDPLANVPDWTARGGISFKRGVGQHLQLLVRFDGVYQSSRATAVAMANPAYFRLPGYSLFDGHLALVANAKWRVSLDVTNLFNRFAAVSGRTEDSNLVRTITPARPRTIALGARFEF